MFIELFIFSAVFLVIFGHNLWLVENPQKSGKKRIDINTGDDFPESDSAIKTERIAGFRVISDKGESDVTDFKTEGTSLVAAIEMNAPFIAAIELYAHPITLEASRFAHYIGDEDAARFTAPDFIAGETLAEQREAYSKFAKALVGGGSDNLSQLGKPVGHRLEILFAGASASGKAMVQVLFENKPLPNLRVSVGAEGLNGGKYAAHVRTDENGQAEIEITRPGHWFVRTHYIRKHADSANFEWESFWASVTFRV